MPAKQLRTVTEQSESTSVKDRAKPRRQSQHVDKGTTDNHTNMTSKTYGNSKGYVRDPILRNALHIELDNVHTQMKK